MAAPRPTTFVNIALSADGKIADAQSSGARFTSPYDRKHMDVLRHDVDAIILGGRTLRHANPSCIIKDAQALRARATRGQSPQPRAVIVTRAGPVPKDARIFLQAGAAPSPWVVAPQDMAPALQQHVGPLAQVLGMGQREVDLAALMTALHEDGVRRALVEGGGALTWALFAQDLIDELHVTYAPCLIGGAQAPTALDGAGWPLHERRHLELLGCRQVGHEIFAHYRLRRQP